MENCKEIHQETHHSESAESLLQGENLESMRKITSNLQMIRLTVDLSAQTIKSRKQNNIFKLLKEKNCQPKILYPAKLPFKNEGKIKTFPDKQKQNLLLASLPYKNH